MEPVSRGRRSEEGVVATSAAVPAGAQKPLQAPEGRQSQCLSAPAKAGGGRPPCRPSLLPVCLSS